MIEVKLGKDFINKYCYHARKDNTNSIAVVFPKEEIEHYWEYIESYGTNYSPNEYTYGTISNKNQFSYIVAVEAIDEDIVIFKFPDEETAFYFKLKYG